MLRQLPAGVRECEERYRKFGQKPQYDADALRRHDRFAKVEVIAKAELILLGCDA